MAENIYDVLREEHQKQRTLIDLIAKTHGDSQGRQELFERLTIEARAHTAVEERVFYSTLLADELTRDKAGHSVEEHNEAEEILEELSNKDMSSTGWLNRFHTLAEALRHHMDEEEQEVFQLAGKALSDAQAKQMAKQYRAEKPKQKKDEKAA
jgi:hemerythrin-like domain-containing protein